MSGRNARMLRYLRRLTGGDVRQVKRWFRGLPAREKAATRLTLEKRKELR